MNDEDSEKNFLAKLYAEIIDGFSEIKWNNRALYVRHLTLYDSFKLLSLYEDFILKGLSSGLLKEDEKVKDAIDGGWWSSELEQKVSMLKTTIRNLYKTKQKIAYESQKAVLQEQIQKNEFILTSLLTDRSGFVGYTCEQYADSKYEQYLLSIAIFEDRNLTKTFLNDETLEDISENDISRLVSLYNEVLHKFSVKNIKKIGASGFMQNLIFSCEDSYCFWGKAINQCTRYQNDIFLYAKMYRNIIKSNAEIGKPIHEDIVSSPEKLIAFVEKKQVHKQSNKASNKVADNNTVSSYVGATGNDLKEMGVSVEKFGGKSLLQIAREKGGIIEKSDYLGVREKSKV